MELQHASVIFNEWLKRRRKALDLTQDELAQRAGCSVGALRKIESGERRPSKQLAGLLAKALEISNEDQQVFIRLARGQENLEQVRQPSIKPSASVLDPATIQPGQQSVSPETKSSRPANRVPLQATPLIGRESEFSSLERLFNDPQCRLLTLTGVGGIGKTRLAIEFGARKPLVFPGGVFYIPLSPIRSAEKIVPTIADVLDFGFSGPSEPKEQLYCPLAYLFRRRCQAVG